MDVRTTPETLPDTVNDIPVQKASTTARATPCKFSEESSAVFVGRTDLDLCFLFPKLHLVSSPRRRRRTAAAGDFKSVELSGVRRIRAAKVDFIAQN